MATETHTQPASTDVQDLLVAGLPYGVGAFVVGSVVTILVIGPGVFGNLSVTDGMFFYVWTHGIVRMTGPEGAGMLVAESTGAAIIWAAIAALPLAVLGHYAVRRNDATGDGASDGALAGAALAGGYAIPMVLVALLVELNVGNVALLAEGALSLDPITALLAGVLFGGVFGAFGGLSANWSRGKYVFYPVVALLTGLTLLAILGAQSA
ncbi:hypothetical protein ACKVMT_06115 [Halobacteriales archaeon Cl-PHB]